MGKPTAVTIDPPMEAWSLHRADAGAAADRAALLQAAGDHAGRLGLPAITYYSAGKSPRILATGHQALAWHPGILAKGFAALAAAGKHDAVPLHLVVDQDEHPVWAIDLPRVVGPAVQVDRHRLGGELPGVPTGFQPPVDGQRLADWLGGLGLSVPDGAGRLDAARTLAEQAAVVLDHWRGAADARLPIVFTSDLIQSEAFGHIVSLLRDHAEQAIRAYNRAVYGVPEAGLRPLAIGREWIELPLWACRWEQPRQRVYADVSDSKPILIDESGTQLTLNQAGPERRAGPGPATLMPRALLMTALMRSTFCDLFIHGKGGGVYDHATEQWWRDWRVEELSPMATVSADVHLDLDVPTATAGDVDQAVWFAHHLRFNVDRFTEVDPKLAAEKRELIEHMDDDRDKGRRARTFRRIVEINDTFAARHTDRLAHAQRSVETARVGLANAAALGRRDWCFGIYPSESLANLRQRVTDLSGMHTEI